MTPHTPSTLHAPEQHGSSPQNCPSGEQLSGPQIPWLLQSLLQQAPPSKSQGWPSTAHAEPPQRPPVQAPEQHCAALEQAS